MDIEFLLSIKLLVVAGVFALFAIFERIHPVAGSPLLIRFGRATKVAWMRLLKNLSLLGINALLSPLIVVPITVDGELLGAFGGCGRPLEGEPIDAFYVSEDADAFIVRQPGSDDRRIATVFFL